MTKKQEEAEILRHMRMRDLESSESRWLPFAVRLDYAELDEICRALEATNHKGPLLEALKKTKADLWKYLP